MDFKKFLMLPFLMWFIPVGAGMSECGLQDVNGNLTTCRLFDGILGTCLFPFGVCCPKESYCCPMGFTCKENSRQCTGVLHPSFFSASDKLCPDNTECPACSSCCLVNPFEYGCCPLEDAVCCPDQIHCCPKDTLCSEDSELCFQVGVRNENELMVIGFHRSISYA